MTTGGLCVGATVIQEKVFVARWVALKRSPYNVRARPSDESGPVQFFVAASGEVDGVQVAGYGRFPMEFFLDGGLEGLCGGGFAVGQIGLFGWRGKRG